MCISDETFVSLRVRGVSRSLCVRTKKTMAGQCIMAIQIHCNRPMTCSKVQHIQFALLATTMSTTIQRPRFPLPMFAAGCSMNGRRKSVVATVEKAEERSSRASEVTTLRKFERSPAPSPPPAEERRNFEQQRRAQKSAKVRQHSKKKD